MKRTILLVSMLLVLAVGFLLEAGDVNVTGKWEQTVETPRGERTRPLEFVQDGEKLTVKMKDRDGNAMEAEGTVKGAAVEWSLTRETRRGAMTMTFTGTVDGDSMSGTVKVGDFGERTWTAKRL